MAVSVDAHAICAQLCGVIEPTHPIQRHLGFVAFLHEVRVAGVVNRRLKEHLRYRHHDSIRGSPQGYVQRGVGIGGPRSATRQFSASSYNSVSRGFPAVCASTRISGPRRSIRCARATSAGTGQK